MTVSRAPAITTLDEDRDSQQADFSGLYSAINKYWVLHYKAKSGYAFIATFTFRANAAAVNTYQQLSITSQFWDQTAAEKNAMINHQEL